eukprot:367516-Pelagomonas_calceolata.AAC.7
MDQFPLKYDGSSATASKKPSSTECNAVWPLCCPCCNVCPCLEYKSLLEKFKRTFVQFAPFAR